MERGIKIEEVEILDTGYIDFGIGALEYHRQGMAGIQ